MVELGICWKSDILFLYRAVYQYLSLRGLGTMKLDRDLQNSFNPFFTNSFTKKYQVCRVTREVSLKIRSSAEVLEIPAFYPLLDHSFIR